ncbi:Glycosyltransferase involved in cell wall bisynthesis [Cyclonatronum proteinivorum]|uniref:Glycosyltransferase involved in cell wall bisynthesis n=1 Tax=Cyclonatronum proteinivorum TaxID=1457365 RepID=A0A345UMG6_9BACT|nr:glycosyltransferase [Cyclonatronum proteinivorum]AXJ01668.1 Glycosyltransferase involved in cell wall bisynthesis [Cyclonatronum proteinivorum]
MTLKDKKLCICIPALKAGGSERVAAELANYALSLGVEVHIILMSDQEVFYKLNTNVQLHIPKFKKGNKLVYYLRVIWFIRKRLKENKLVHVFSLGYRLIPVLASIGMKIDHSGSHRTSINRGWKPFKLSGVKRNIFDYFYRTASNYSKMHTKKMIYQTPEAMEHYQKSYPNADAVVLPNFLREIKLYNTDRQKVVLCIGRLSPEKGQIYLVEAFSKVNYHDWKLIFVGDGPARNQLEKRVEELGLTSSIIFEGFKENVDEYMQASEIFVLPSLHEGFPNALLEAMANGLACISFSSNYGSCELIDHGVNGYLVETMNVDELAKQIENLINDSNTRTKFQKNATEVLDKYSLDKIGKAYLHFILN